MPSPADRERQAREDVERIAAAMFEGMRDATPGLTEMSWGALDESLRAPWRMMARALLQRDVIRVGKRPDTGPAPMEGQVSLDD